MLKNAALDAKICEKFAKSWQFFDKILTRIVFSAVARAQTGSGFGELTSPGSSSGAGGAMQARRWAMQAMRELGPWNTIALTRKRALVIQI